MTTNNTAAVHPITVVDPTYVDPRSVAQTLSNVDPFGVVRSAGTRLTAVVQRRRQVLAERRHRAQTQRLLVSDARMRAEFEAHFGSM